MKIYHSKNSNDTEEIAKAIAKVLTPGDVIAFKGGMGVGKTTFVRGLAEGLQIQDDVSSPTFSLVNEYTGKTNLYHFDMYRINDINDLYSTGFFDYLDQDAIIVVEWSENIQNALPDKTITIEIQATSQNGRTIKIYGDDRF